MPLKEIKMQKIRVGFIGLGERGSNIIKTTMAIDNAELVAVCDGFSERVEKGIALVKQISGKLVDGYTDCVKLLERKDIDAVIIATSWETHISIAIKAMKYGKAVAMEVGGAYDLEECWELVRTQEQTKVPFMMLENCCFDEFETLITCMHRVGKFGAISHAHGAYRHDLRKEIFEGNLKKHYRLQNYINRNGDNYPTHALGPIAKILDINRGNKFMSLVSMSSVAQGLEAYSYSEKNPDKSLVGQKFKQGDVVSTIIKCANGETITLTLNTCLPNYYSRELELYGTKGLCRQEEKMIMLEEDVNLEECWFSLDTVKEHIDNVKKYDKYIHPYWKTITEEEKKLGHGGMDYLIQKCF